MQSFRTEIENPLVEQDILDLEKKIRLFNEGNIDEEKFRSLRLARGVYGQRQQGVQMVRIKLPYGKVTGEQLHRIADVSDEYSTGRLHITTRQDIQIHHVSLDRTPELWAQLEKDDITLREACGNTVRNVTASPMAGVDPNEAFDVSPYAYETFQFFLRNPFCQEMGRKFKMSFSGSDEDDALAFMHDLGFIAKIREENGRTSKGFKVLLGGGLGSQPSHGIAIHEFLETKYLIPLVEGVLRVFDRHGERNRRNKARLKFLVNDIGEEAFLRLVREEQKVLGYTEHEIDTAAFEHQVDLPDVEIEDIFIKDHETFELWKKTNLFSQKQTGLFAIGINVHLGDFYTDKARKLADLIKNYASNELRFTLRQDMLIRNVREELLPFFYRELSKLGFADAGYNSTKDITACPGTDTCNLGIASSTGIAAELDRVIQNEFPRYIQNDDITIKISGCMNACGQHSIAHIGFQGMSVKAGALTAPALQVLLGGGVLGNGKGRFADKVIKVPSKRGPEALRRILRDFEAHAGQGENFLGYYDRQGKIYFFNLLRELSDTTNLQPEDFIDWGHNEKYVKEIGVGECAGVVIDLVATLLFESEEKIDLAEKSLRSEKWSDAIYHAYSSIVNSAKAIMTSDGLKTNSHASIIKGFDEAYIREGKINLVSSFEDFAYQINQNEPRESFAKSYLDDAKVFYEKVDRYRVKELTNAQA
ncbi:MAG: HEPN domain-containing protein [Ekhidna sp.]|nr:HEPN domain-containing protein [Ekhidna sp.]